MKDAFLRAIITTLVGAVVLFFISLFGVYFSEPNGQVIISDISDQNNVYEQIVFVEIWKETPRRIQFSVFDVEAILIDDRISINEIEKTGNKTTYEIYNIKMNVTIPIKLVYQNLNGKVYFEEIKTNKILLGLYKKTNLDRVLEVVIPLLLIYGLMTFIQLLLNNRHIENIRKSNEDISEKLNNIKGEYKEKMNEMDIIIKKQEDDFSEKKQELENNIIKFKQRLNAVTKVQSNYRIIQSYKIRDLSKELDFWYNVLRNLMLKIYGRDETATKELIREIRNTLHVEGNITLINDPKTIEFYEKMYSNDVDNE